MKNTTEIKFGTSGWRGIMGKDFTMQNLCIVIQRIADYLKTSGQAKQGIITGYDTRFMSKRFAETASHILAQNNIPVFLAARDTPTPAIAFHIINRCTAGAINITASHNPPEYNGIKFSTSYGGPAAFSVTEEIEKGLGRKGKYQAFPTASVSLFNPKPKYIKHLCSLIDIKTIKKARLKIAIDCMHGTARDYIDHILGKACIITTLNNHIDALFGGRMPDPREETLSLLKDTVLRTKSHLGLATDGDADRFGIIDRDGTYISSNNILALILDHLIMTRKDNGGVVRSISTTHLLDAIAKKHNREIYEVPVGFKYIGSTLLEKGAIMGGEESGGMTIKGHVPEKDGILACLLIAELAGLRKKSLGEIIKDMQKEYGTFYNKRVDVKIDAETKEAILKKLEKRPQRLGILNVNKYDKLESNNTRFIFSDREWLIIRPSGTEPLLRCYIEAGTKKNLVLLEKNLLTFVRR